MLFVLWEFNEFWGGGNISRRINSTQKKYNKRRRANVEAYNFIIKIIKL